MRNISGTEKFYEQKSCDSTISISLYFYFSFIEKIILSSENRSLDNTFARSPECGEFFDPAAQFVYFSSCKILEIIQFPNVQTFKIVKFEKLSNSQNFTIWKINISPYVKLLNILDVQIISKKLNK